MKHVPNFYHQAGNEWDDYRTKEEAMKEEELNNKNKFYFTFGTHPQFPFYKGWVEVIADTREEAVEIYNSYYPPKHGNTINCSFIYSQEEFEQTEMFKGTWGDGCHKVLDCLN